MAVANLDLDTGAWSITHTYSMPETGFGGGLFPLVTSFPVWRVRRYAGTTHLIHESPPALIRVDAPGRRLVPVALASHKYNDTNTNSPLLLAALTAQGHTLDESTSDGYTWSDINGDGELDPDEFRFHSLAAPLAQYCAFDDDLNIYLGYQEATNYAWTGSR